MLPAFPTVTTQLHSDSNDVDLDDLKSSVLSNKAIFSKWIQTTERPLQDVIKRTKSKIATETKKEINYVDELLKKKLLSKKAVKCQFQNDSPKNGESKKCKRDSLPYANYCNEHISQSSDQLLFKRCSVKLKNNQQCPNNLLNGSDDKHEICQQHLISFKNGENVDNNQDNKELIKNHNGTKGKRKYVKSTTPGNENKPKKTRKKKDQQTNQANGANSNLIKNNLVAKDQQYAYNSCYSNDLTDNLTAANFGFNQPTDQQLIDIHDHHYAPSLVAGNLSNGNLNQLSNLNNSEDSLAAIVNNSDLASVQFEESELREILGKIPEDAFNDIFMDNLSTDCADLKSIDNIAFNNSCDVNLEPSISLNFKSNSNCFNTNDNQQINNLVYSQKQTQKSILNNTTQDLMNSSDMIYLPNNLINNQPLQSNEQIKPMNYFNDNMCTMSNLSNSNYNSYNVLDFKQQNNVTTFSSPMVHPAPPNYNSTYMQSNNSLSNSLSNSYPSAIGQQQMPQQNANHLLNGGNQQMLNDHHHLNHLQHSPANNSIILNDEQNYQSGNLNNLNDVNNLPIASTNQNYSVHNTISSITNKHELQDKKFNLFTNNCKANYGNIYDDLPSFESNNHLNGTSTLPSFSMINIVKKNRIESR